ncbi:hypothetical protein EV142_102699 [Flavobacterium circumlabens]|uniref:Uncharacterized protein n=1 Tax=Flavobacterium circumlabens TaxID=2133765 RepID=A0ABY2B3H2_9FLAO|nr:hypothetical protein EV142_102699 [Flavobacterium circumlabens]
MFRAGIMFHLCSVNLKHNQNNEAHYLKTIFNNFNFIYYGNTSSKFQDY